MRPSPFFLCLPLWTACLPLGSSEGSTTSWHLEEHDISIGGKKEVSVVADCRGNNSLNWEVRTEKDKPFVQPDQVLVYCGMYASRPYADEFEGWGWTKRNWTQSKACTTKQLRTMGIKDKYCDDYFRAKRDSQSIDAPWCKITFDYGRSETTQDATLITYCVTR